VARAVTLTTVTSSFDSGPGPRRGAFLLAYAGVLVGGLLGALIGYGLTDLDCTGDCGSAVAVGSLVGGIVGAVGTGVVAVLVLRAMAEWRRPK
jgi:uncharacterized protein YqgC (DUF456 family)